MMSISLYTIIKENEEDIDNIKRILEEDEKEREIDYYRYESNENGDWYSGLTLAMKNTIKDERWMEISRIIMKNSKSRKRINNDEGLNDFGIQFIWSYPNIFSKDFEIEMMNTEYIVNIFLIPQCMIQEGNGIDDDRIINCLEHSKYELWTSPFTIQLNIKRIVETKRRKVIRWLIKDLDKENEKDYQKKLIRGRSNYMRTMIEHLIYSYQYDVIELFLEMEESMNYEYNMMKDLVSREDMEIEDLMIKIWEHSNRRMRDESMDILYKYSKYGWYGLMRRIVEERRVEDFVNEGWIWISYFEEFYKKNEEYHLRRIMMERIKERYKFIRMREEIWYKIIDYF